MQQNKKLILFWLTALLLVSCIKPFDPDISLSDTDKVVINAQINDIDTVQKIEISLTSAISKPEFKPLSGCSVRVVADDGTSFGFYEATAGDYFGTIDPAYLQPGALLRLEVITPQGERIESAADRMPQGPEISEVYWELTTLEGNRPGNERNGIQFYTDLHAEAWHSRFFRWEIVETWEYHADYPFQWYYDGAVHQVIPADYSRLICWKTAFVPYVYSLNTINLTNNAFERFPLHFVSNLTARLAYGYSVEVRQYALSETSFAYWEQMRLNNEQDAGLFEKQPVPVQGNLRFADNDKEVLGNFSVSAIRRKRLFVDPVPGLELDFSTGCSATVLEKGFREIRPYEYPVYLLGDDVTYSMVLLSDGCVDCLVHGGINVKPSFWPR